MHSSARQRLAKYGLLCCAQLLAALVFVLLSRAESGRPRGTHDVRLAMPALPRRLAIVFVDSLSDRTALDAEIMPKLAALARGGVSLEVTPCRDQLTYLCLRALLTGYDESSLIAVRGNFSQEKSVSDNLLDRLFEAGRRVTVVGSHDFAPYQASLFKAKFGAGEAASEALLFRDLAAIVSVITVCALRVHRLATDWQRCQSAALALCIACLLWSLYGLRDVGGQTREMAYFVFSSPLFDRYAKFTLCALTGGIWLSFARAKPRSRRDLELGAGLGVASVLLECHALRGARYLLPAAIAAYLWLRLMPDTSLVASRFFTGLIALGLFYGEDALHVAPMLALALCLLLTLSFWHSFFPDEPEARATANGLTLAIACYFMLWPTLGMRFSGIDFRFMFDWVPIARYEELWLLIALGALLKFIWPYALLADLARRTSNGRARAWLCVAFAAKVVALAVFAAWYATSHGLLTNGALEILAELALLILLSAFAWPSPLRALARVPRLRHAFRRSAAADDARASRSVSLG